MLKPVGTDIEALKILDERLLWLAAWTIHNANHIRENSDGLKVGGHQASCASMTTIMAALYFHALGANDRVAVKLVEIASLGCPFCRKFEEEGATRLVEDYVKSGKVSWEFRPFLIHGSIDLAANLVARCNGPTTFFPLMQAMYKDQPVWMAKIQAVPQARLEEVQNLPTNQIFVQIAKLVGFQDWAAARGVPQAKTNQCLADQAMIDHEVQVTSDVGNQYPDFKGTPSFILNGKLLPETNDWAKLKPQLDAAVK